MSGINCCERKGKVQDWVEKEAKLPRKPDKAPARPVAGEGFEVVLPSALSQVTPALWKDVECPGQGCLQLRYMFKSADLETLY